MVLFRDKFMAVAPKAEPGRAEHRTVVHTAPSSGRRASPAWEERQEKENLTHQRPKAHNGTDTSQQGVGAVGGRIQLRWQ